jgi:HAMP domain-containing protein
MTALRQAGRWVATMVPVSQLARLGLPALIMLCFLALVVLAIWCWIIDNDDRSNRLTRLILAARGHHAVPAPAAGAVSKARRWFGRRKRRTG